MLFCRNLEIQFLSLRRMVKYMTPSECQELCDGKSEFLSWLVRELAHALTQSDRFNRRNSTSYHSTHFLLVLDSLCSSSDQFVRQLVGFGLVNHLVTVIKTDIQKVKSDQNFRWDLSYAANCLWTVLVAEGNAHKALVESELGGVQGSYTIKINN